MLTEGGKGQGSGCGFARGLLHDNSRPAWQGCGPRPLPWCVWYPAGGSAAVPAQPALATDFFEPGAILPDAEPTGAVATTVILLSHGTGGTAESLGWVARLLAGRGCMVIAANHHGNTGVEAYRPEGFLCWWERATDLSLLLSHFRADPRFGPPMAQAPVAVVGYSLGAHTALALMGGVTSMPQFQDFGRDHPAMARGPREFPDLPERMEGLFETSAAFRDSWARHGQPFRDARVSAAILLAPPPPVRACTPASLAAIDRPVSILAGRQDKEADAGLCAGWLCAQNPRFRLDLLEDLDHYGFLGPLTPRGAALLGGLIGNATTQERTQMHDRIAAWLLDQAPTYGRDA